jgi:hypothetical protein
MKINNFIKTSLCLFLVLLQCFAEAQGVTILPQSTSLADMLGMQAGQALQQDLQQAGQAEFNRQQYIQDQTIIQSYNQQLLDLLVQQQQFPLAHEEATD